MSRYDGLNFLPYDNEVIAVKLENELITKLDLMKFAHKDESLSQNPGMVKKIRTYHGTGSVQELGMGEGNTETMGAYFTEKAYEVGTTQGKVEYYDETLMDDPVVIDKGIERMAQEMVNDLTRKLTVEFERCSNKIMGASFGFDVVADAVALFPDEETENEPLSLLINRKDQAAWKKALKDDLKYVEDFSRKGYIGHVCGVPMFWSDAIPQGRAFILTPEAVTVFVKKGVEVEQDRNPNIRKNELYSRKVALVALTNDDKIIEISNIADPRTGYVKVAAKPADWDTKYATDYYFFDAVALTLALNTEANWEKVAGFIYKEA